MQRLGRAEKRISAAG